MMLFISNRVSATEGDDSDWDSPPVAGPSLSKADDQFIDLLVGDSDSDNEPDEEKDPTPSSTVADGTQSHEDDDSSATFSSTDERDSLSLGELATDHITMATTFLGRSVRRVSGSINLNPSALVPITRARASSIIGETVQHTKALSNTILDMTVNRAMRLSSEAISVANERTHAAFNRATTTLSPPRVQHENGRVKRLPEAIAERIACNSPDLSKLVLRANEYTSFGCSLSAEACRCFRENTTLRDLYLYGWNVDDAGAAHFALCSSLRRLRLVENAITDVGAESLAQNLYLRELDLSKGDWPLLSSTTITSAGAAHLASLRYLTILQLSGHHIGDQGVALLAAGLTWLRVLGLSQNHITDAGVTSLSQLTSLTYLDLSRNSLGVAGCTALAQHPSLIVLNVARNNIDDAALSSLFMSPRIAFLSVACCTATPSALSSSLVTATALTALDISNSSTMLTPAGLTQLSQHPGLTFCDARQAHPDINLDGNYWTALRKLEDTVSANLQLVLTRRRKIVLLFISLARQQSAVLKGSNPPQVLLPLDLLMVILGFASPADYGKTPLQLQSLCRWIFRNMTEVERRLRERRSLHVIERCYYTGVPETFRFAEESSGTCIVS